MTINTNVSEMLQENRGRSGEIARKASELSVKLDNDPTIHPQFHADIYIVLRSAVEICSALIEPNYSIDKLVPEASRLMHALGTVMEHAALSRSAKTAYGLVREDGILLDLIFPSEEEALHHINKMTSWGVSVKLIVTEVSLLPSAVIRPSLPEKQTS